MAFSYSAVSTCPQRDPGEIHTLAQRVGRFGPFLGGGYRVHLLSGARKGQRSARLSRQWRVIFKVLERELIVEAMELTLHKY